MAATDEQHHRRLPQCEETIGAIKTDIAVLSTEREEDQRLMGDLAHAVTGLQAEIRKLETAAGDRIVSTAQTAAAAAASTERLERRLDGWVAKAWAVIMLLLANLIGLVFALIR